MKFRYGIMIGSLLFAILTVIMSLSDGNTRGESVRIPLPGHSEPILPRHPDGPLPKGKKLPFAEAQKMVSYKIPVPDAVKIKQVWVSIDTASDESVAIEFSSKLLLIIHKMENPPDWDKIIESVPELTKINVNGNAGVGADPGYTTSGENKFFYPGSVGWWVDGLKITLYSDTLSLKELLKIAKTVR